MDAQVKLESKVVFDQNANRIMAHGREWISLHDCGDGIHIAVEPSDVLPCPLQLVTEHETP